MYLGSIQAAADADADLLQGKASDAYDSAANAAHEATREPTTFEKAKGAFSPPSTADNIRAGTEDTAAAASARFQAVKDSIAAVGQPAQKSYFQQAKVFQPADTCHDSWIMPWVHISLRRLCLHMCFCMCVSVALLVPHVGLHLPCCMHTDAQRAAQATTAVLHKHSP